MLCCQFTILKISHRVTLTPSDPDLKDDVRFPIPASSGPETLKQLEPTEEGSCSGKGMFYQRSQSEIPSRNNGGASGRSGMFSRSLTYPCAPASGSLKHVHPGKLKDQYHMLRDKMFEARLALSPGLPEI